MRSLPALMLLGCLVACGEATEPSNGGDDGPTVDPAIARKAAALELEAATLLRSDPARAIELLTESIGLRATADAHLARARAHLSQAAMVMPGSMPEAVAADVDAALALDADHVPTLFFKAQRLGIGRKDGQEILDHIAHVSVSRDDAEGLYLRARAVAGLRDAEKWSVQAQRDFDRAAELRPADAEILLRYGSFLIRTVRDEEEAAKVLRKAVALDPDGKDGRAAKELLDEL